MLVELVDKCSSSCKELALIFRSALSDWIVLIFSQETKHFCSGNHSDTL